jgi:hyperosmotically inducible periplasmic protein
MKKNAFLEFQPYCPRRRKAMKKELKNIILLLVMVAFGMSLFAGCARLTGKTAGETVDDATITTQANAIIVDDPSAAFLKIDVDTRLGNVRLNGVVPDKETEQRIVKRIREIRGVKSVESNLTVEQRN